MKIKLIQIICAIVFILTHNLLFSNSVDSIEVRGRFLIMKNQFIKGNLYQFNTQKIIKSFKIENGDFKFQLPSSIDPGVYRLQYEREVDHVHTDIIIDGTETLVSFELKYIGKYSYPDFKVSVRNKKWYNYLKESDSRVDRLTRLFDYLSNFSNQITGKQIVRIYQKERKKYYKLFTEFVTENTNQWEGLVVANTPYYFSDLKKKPVERDFIRLNYYWKDIDASNPKLINTPVYSEHIENYLNKVIKDSERGTISYREYKLNKAVDIVIEQFSKTTKTERFAIEYLKSYFNKRNQNDSILNYVAQKENLGIK